MGKIICIAIWLVFVWQIALPQKDYVEADGVIEYHNRIPLPGATLVIYEDGHEIKRMKTGEEGRYNFIMEYNKEYILEISKKNLITKKVKYNTVMPPKAKGGWWIGIPINLYEVCPGIDASVFDNPVAIVRYDKSKKEYEADPSYDNRMRGRIQAFESKNDACLEDKFVKLVRDGEQLMKEKKYEEAKTHFEEATNKRPWEPYPKEKLNELESLMAKKDAKLEMYKQNIQLADKLLNEGNLVAAKSYYKRAAAMKPSEPYPGQKIREIDLKLDQKENQLVASIKQSHADEQQRRDQQKKDQQYNDAIKQGNLLMNKKQYTGAKQSFLRAQQIKPGATIPQQKLNEINKLLAQAEEKRTAQRNKKLQYQQQIDKADELLNTKSYERAKEAYQVALSMKPDDQYPKQKIESIHQMLEHQALIAQQKEKESKYNKAISDADGYLAIHEYALAKQSYSLALSIKPEESYPRIKISKIDDKIANKELQEQQQREIDKRYNQFIQLADNYFQSGELKKARSAYNKALVSKPDEPYPKERVQMIDERVAANEQALQEQQKRQAEYQQAIAQGDQLFGKKEYAPAKLYYLKALRLKGEDAHASSRINEIEARLAAIKKQKLAEKEKQEKFNHFLSYADDLLDGAKYEEAKGAYHEALEIDPTSDYAKKRIAQINNILAKLAASNQIIKKENKKIANEPLPELKFNDDDELNDYLVKLQQKYPEGITLEIYKEEKKTIRRFIIIRNNEAAEFREVKHYWGGTDYSWNDKPITQQYFRQQTKQRTNEYYNVVEM